MLVFARRLSRYSLASPHDEYSLLSHTPDDGGQDLKAWWPGISVVCLGEPFLSRQLVRTEPLSRLTFILSLPYIAETNLGWVLRSRHIFGPTPSPGLALPSRAREYRAGIRRLYRLNGLTLPLLRLVENTLMSLVAYPIRRDLQGRAFAAEAFSVPTPRVDGFFLG